MKIDFRDCIKDSIDLLFEIVYNINNDNEKGDRNDCEQCRI